MKLYATIDGGTVVASVNSSFLPNDHWAEYEVDHVDQLVITDNNIVVDKTQPNKIEVYKQQGKDRNRFGELSQIISDYVADKELYNNGIIDSMSITEEEYRNILIEYKSFKDKLS
jgi:hypothetical protein